MLPYWVIGKSNSGHYYFDGSISELAVFNYALSSTQVSTLYGSSSLGAGNPLALKPALVAYYNLADNSSGNPLTQPNEAVEDASVFDFDGSGSVINLGNTDSLKLRSGDFTFSVWINPDSWGSSYRGIYVNNNTNGVFIGKGNGNEFVLRIFNVSNIIAYSTLPPINTWTHICITRNNGLCSLFYNGSSVATATSAHDFSGSADVFIDQIMLLHILMVNYLT